MFNRAFFRVKVLYSRFSRCCASATFPFFAETHSQLQCWTSRPAREVAQAEFNSCSDSFLGLVRLLAGRQPCFG